ncbi:alkyl hydroperoxide reductase subunit AhpC [Sporohalobacter salinus]|nr:alkyl hydroperoxide reductase subunit AhpC [Sporohalobacter salinus]
MSNQRKDNSYQSKTPRVCLPQIGAEAPGFTAITTFGERSLSDYRDSWLVFFAHPGDFTPV